MSNQNIAKRISLLLDRLRAREISPRTAAAGLAANGRALEGMPYELVKTLQSLVMDLEIAQWEDEEGCVPDVDTVLSEFDAWLRQVPLEV